VNRGDLNSRAGTGNFYAYFEKYRTEIIVSLISMKIEQITEIIDILPQGRTIFYYFKDRYALELLSWYIGPGKTVREIKESPYRGLLHKPILRPLLVSLPSGCLTPGILQSIWPRETEAYLLTLGQWGEKGSRWDRSYYQTSRAGVNLVLQLNFSGKHNQRYYSLIKPDEYHPFDSYGHPVNTTGRHTLAWARIDLDLDDGEALIEEIQTDWIRDAMDDLAWLERKWRRYRQVGIDPQQTANWNRYRKLVYYVKDVLHPHVKMWDEAMLTAAIWFLRQELGLRRIFYHTFASGNQLKGFTSDHPPRSLYTTLPRKFCFQQTHQYPHFLRHSLKKKIQKKKTPATPSMFLLEI
jgi:hypothetical protein